MSIEGVGGVLGVVLILAIGVWGAVLARRPHSERSRVRRIWLVGSISAMWLYLCGLLAATSWTELTAGGEVARRAMLGEGFMCLVALLVVTTTVFSIADSLFN